MIKYSWVLILKQIFFNNIILLLILLYSLSFAFRYRVISSPPSTFKKYLLELTRDTWKCFVKYTCNKTGLPYDRSTPGNPQTSITNIGLYMASIAAAYDLGFINRSEALNRLKKTIDTLFKLKKWHGIPYNWYDAETLSPIWGNFISSVDAGWYAAGLIVARNAFPELYENISKLIDMMEWDKLYDASVKRLYVGYDSIKKHYTSGHYDYLAIESRMASIIGIGSGKIPSEHWYALKRDMVSYKNISFLWGWGAGLFIYYFPGIFLDERGSFISRSTINVTIAQIIYSEDHGYPVWGFSPCDIPGGGYGMKFDVVTPHASTLAIIYFPEKVYLNLKMLEEMGVRTSLGFKDSISMVSGRVDEDFLALDQGMILLSIANYLNSSIWKYCMKDVIIENALKLINEYNIPDEVLNTYNFIFNNVTDAVLNLIMEEKLPISAMDKLLKAKLLFGSGNYNLALKYARECLTLIESYNVSETKLFVKDEIERAARNIDNARKENRLSFIDKAESLYNDAKNLYDENNFVSAYVKARIARFYASISKVTPVTKKTKMFLNVVNKVIRYPEEAVIKGNISPPISADILIERKVNNLWKGVKIVSINGNFTFTLKLNPGNYSFRAVFYGLDKYLPCISNTINIVVLKGVRSLNITGFKKKATVGENITFSGEISPMEEIENITIKITDPSKKVAEKVVKIDENGFFKCIFKVNIKGVWQIEVVVNETEKYSSLKEVYKINVSEIEKPETISSNIQTLLTIILIVILAIVILLVYRRSKIRSETLNKLLYFLMMII